MQLFIGDEFDMRTASSFVGIADAAAILGMGTRKARTFLIEHGLPGVNTSNGARATWQWSRRAIETLIDTLQSESSAPVQTVPRTKSSPRLAEMTPREVYCWLNKENNNGNQDMERKA